MAFSDADVQRTLTMVRAAALRLPESSERLSHGGPAFFIRGKKCFVMFVDDHHEDGRLAIWCAAPDGVQAEMVETEPERSSGRRTSEGAAGSACTCSKSTSRSSTPSCSTRSVRSRHRRCSPYCTNC